MSSVNTRSGLSCSLSKVVGPGRALLVSELPTKRDILRLGLMLKQADPRPTYSFRIKELINDIYSELKNQWLKANHRFQYPVTISEQEVKRKLKVLWEGGIRAGFNKVGKANNAKFIEDLDTLFDITQCRCSITTCVENACDATCSEEVHINCICAIEKKIPVYELSYLKGQREKVGTIGTHQMSRVDWQAVKEARRYEHRNMERSTTKKRKVMSEEEMDITDSFDIEDDQQPSTSNDQQPSTSYDQQPSTSIETTPINNYNSLKIPNLAFASLRHLTSTREAAEIATATLKDAGVITNEDITQVIDHNKLRRAQKKVMDKISVAQAKELKDNG